MGYRPKHRTTARALRGQVLRRGFAALAAAGIVLAGSSLAPGINRANDTYPSAVSVEALAADPAGGLAQPAARPTGTNFLTRKAVEGIARKDIGKLHGLRIGPFAPRAHSKPMPLGKAEHLLGKAAALGAHPDTPAWVVTVDAPPKIDILAPQAPAATVFTDVIDAVTGAVIDTCPGCATLDR